MKFVNDLNEGKIPKTLRGSPVAGEPEKRTAIITKLCIKKQRTILRVRMSAKHGCFVT